MFGRNFGEICNQKCLIENVDFTISRDKMVSPREAVRLLSLGNGQGFIYCECKTGTCKTRRC